MSRQLLLSHAVAAVVIAVWLGVVTAATAAGASPATSDAIVREGEEWVVHGGLATDPEGTGSALFLVRPDGTGEHRLVNEVPGTEIRATWSPDGSRIAYVQTTLDDRSELWAIDADGTHPQQLYRCERPCNDVDYPDWAPDGHSIYFQMDANAPADGPPATFEVARYDLSTGEVRAVVTREDGLTVEQPRIAPDGSRVVYTRGQVLGRPTPRLGDLRGRPVRRTGDPSHRLAAVRRRAGLVGR